MAALHSTRLTTKSFSRRRIRIRSATSAGPLVRFRDLSGWNSLKGRTAVSRDVTDPNWVVQLQEIVHVLGEVYSSCVTAQLALCEQNAEQDRDIMRTLRTHVSEPVSRQVERLDAVVMGLKGCSSRAVLT